MRLCALVRVRARAHVRTHTRMRVSTNTCHTPYTHNFEVSSFCPKYIRVFCKVRFEVVIELYFFSDPTGREHQNDGGTYQTDDSSKGSQKTDFQTTTSSVKLSLLNLLQRFKEF